MNYDPSQKKEDKNYFNARKSVVDEHRRREFEKAGGAVIPHKDYQIILEDFLQMSIRRQNHFFAMFKLQAEMLSDLVENENSVAHYKNILKGLDPENADPSDIKLAKSELNKYEKVCTALRDIGDGIAWRMLNFDRFVLSSLGNHPRKQHINIDGLKAELAELANILNDTNHVAILNDLTHILKKGDITCKLSEQEFEIVEVKSSNTKSSRVTRQRQDLIETLSFFNSGQKQEDGETFRTLLLSVTPQSYFKTVERSFLEAEKKGVAVLQIGNHLACHITNFESLSETSNVDSSFQKFDLIPNSWHQSGDFFMHFTSLDQYVNVKNYAPYSVFPIQYRFRVKLMTSSLLVATYLNLSAVLRYLKSRGWTVVKRPEEISASLDKPDPETPLAILNKGALTIHLPAPLIGRLAHEYLSIKTLGDIMDAVYSAGPLAADGIFMNFLGEMTQWD